MCLRWWFEYFIHNSNSKYCHPILTCHRIRYTYISNPSHYDLFKISFRAQNRKNKWKQTNKQKPKPWNNNNNNNEKGNFPIIRIVCAWTTTDAKAQWKQPQLTSFLCLKHKNSRYNNNTNYTFSYTQILFGWYIQSTCLNLEKKKIGV